MRKISYYLILIVVLGSALSAFWVYQRYFKKDEVGFLQFKVERGSIQESLRARGEVAPQKEFDLSFPFSGIVEKIFVKEGADVNFGQTLIKLETIDFELDAQKLAAQLLQVQSNLAKLVAGATKEDIQILETKANSAQKAFDDAQANLKSVENEVEADLKSVYDSGLTSSQKAITVGVNALLTLTDIQYSYFMSTDADSQRLADSKALAVESLLGEKGAGRFSAEAISGLSGGAKASVKNAVSDATFANIDKALSETKGALQKVKDALDSVSVNSKISSTDKTSLSTEKSDISSEIVTLSGKEQAILTQKASGQSNITTAQNSINDAESALVLAQDQLNLKKAPARTEDIEIAEAQIEEIKSQLSSAREKIKKSTIFAPADGKVIKIFPEEGELFRSSEIAVSLFTTGYKIQADISELKVAKINEGEGNDVLLSFDAFSGQEFKGKVVSVDSREITKEGDKFYRVNIFLEKQDVPIRSGMSVDLAINVAFKENILKIPEFSVFEKDNKKFVKVLWDGKIAEAELETGISDGESVEVVKGLQEGQIIVVSAD